MHKGYLGKLKEATISIAPIMYIVLILACTLVPMSWEVVVQFLIAVALLIVGMSCFTLGADSSMIPIGESIGAFLSKTHKVWFMLLVGFLMGVVITIAEPDLMVLANQVSSINTWALVLAVGIGVGAFTVLSILRTLLRVPLNIVLTVAYVIIFILGFFVPPQFAPLAFDSGSVTTGPISVPFLIAFGLGIASVRSNKKTNSDDSFGLVALGSAGPILAVMILGLFVDNSTLSTTQATIINEPESFNDIVQSFLSVFPSSLTEVGIVLLPILVIFLLFQFFVLHLPFKKVLRIILGLLFVYGGIVMFFTGVNVGFLPVGNMIGSSLVAGEQNWYFVPIACVLGAVIALAEPAVHVLTHQVEVLTDGRIPAKTILVCVCIGVAVSLGLCALRVICQFSIWYVLVPAYVLAIILSFIVPHIFTGIAFDSGGVSTGAMATTFVLPLIMGACASLGLDTLIYGFGTLAFIAVTPLLTIQVLGLVVDIVNKRKLKAEENLIEKDAKVDIVEFD
ncbi:MAG: DUF1538 domain-containing protein [Clostridia bacterium]|nr:DUF1538 domain-containing protein [Clostridia bacterium]